VVLSDLAEFVNFVTRVKVVPATADNVAFGETERLRARDFASKLSMRVLSRMWQMLSRVSPRRKQRPGRRQRLKWCCVRIAYVADMPTPDEAIRMLDQMAGLRLSSQEALAGRCSAPAATVSSMPSAPGARGFRIPLRPEGLRAPRRCRPRWPKRRLLPRRSRSQPFPELWRSPARSATC